MSKPTLPHTPQTWINAVKSGHGVVDAFSLSLDDVKRLPSASKLEEHDWLLLRVLVSPESKYPTHNDILGADGDSVKRESRRFLEKEPWWKALQNGNEELGAWGTMALWKRSMQSISQRSTVLAFAPQPRRTLELDDPFKIFVQPEDGRGSRRQVRDKSEQNKALQDQRQKLVNEYVQKQSSYKTDHTQSQSRSGSVGSRESNDGIFGSPGTRRPQNSPESGSEKKSMPPSEPSSALSFESRALANRSPDEALINTSLVLLLQGISMLDPHVGNKYDWTCLHKAFHVIQADAKGKATRKILTAKPDGCLQATPSNQLPEDAQTLAIVEVKPFRRDDKTEGPIAMQESAQMAAWISTDRKHGMLPQITKGVYRRVLISQDFDELYITVAEFDEEYIQYIGTGNPKSRETTPDNSPTRQIASREVQRSSQGVADTPQPQLPVRQRPDQAAGPSSGMAPAPAPRSSGSSLGKLFGSKGKQKAASEDTSKAQMTSSHRADQPGRPLQPSSRDDVFSTPSRPIVANTPNRPDVAAGKSAAYPVEQKRPGTDGFLVMHQYPKFRLSNRDQLKYCIELLHSITVWLCADDKGPTRELFPDSQAKDGAVSDIGGKGCQ